MTTTTLHRAVAAGLLALAVAACGGSTPAEDAPEADVPAASMVADEVAANAPEDAGAIIYEEEVPVPGTTLDACQLITAADVQAAVAADGAVPTGTLEVDPTILSPGHSECTYEGEFGRIIVALTPEDGANLYDAAYGAYDGLEPITGLGDGAFWSDENHRGFVWQERVTTMFTIFMNDPALTGLDVTQSLGAAMIDKL